MSALAKTTAKADSSTQKFSPAHSGLLQRKCACGSSPGTSGMCEECQGKRLQRKLTVGSSNDPLETEADRVVVNKPAPSSVSSLAFGRLQREEAPKEKTNEEKYKEGLEKLGEAFLKTPLGKELLEKIRQDTLVKGATELGKDFISTWPGKIVTGAAATGAVAALAVTHKALPAQIPEIPLDVLTPGLSVQLTYKGPVDKPTEAMITFKFTEQAPKGRDDKKPMSATDKFRAETARIAAENAKFRAGMTYEPGSAEDLQQKAEQEAIRNVVLKYSGGPDIETTIKKYPWLATPQPKTGLQLTLPKPSFGIKPPALLGDEFKLKPPSEQKKKEDEPTLQKKLSIGASNDPLEDEADRVADQVLAAPANPAVGGAPTRIQRVTGQATEGTDTAPGSVDRVLASSGRPMEPALRQDMEQRFGHDFSRVRVHAGGAAEQSAREVNANAYTVGHNVVFGTGRFAPGTNEGRRLLAHELTHVVQQSSSDGDRAEPSSGKRGPSPNYPSLLQMAPAGPGPVVMPLLVMNSDRTVGTTAAPTDNLREEVLLAMDRLHTLWSMTNADYNAEYPLVSALPPGSQVTIPIPKTLDAIKKNSEGSLAAPVGKYALDAPLSSAVGDKQPNQKGDILAVQTALNAAKFLSDADFKVENGAATKDPGPAIKDVLIPKTIAAISDLKMAIAGGSFVPGVVRTNIFQGTHPVTAKEHVEVEAVLTPGATLVAAPVVKGKVAPPPVIKLPPAMTGAGVGGLFETDMKSAITTYLSAKATAFRTLKAAGPPSFPIAKANDLAGAAQDETEKYFKPYLKVAPRVPSAPYHSGVYGLASKLGDQSARPLTDAGTPGNPGRIGWMGYWMKHGDGKKVLDKYHCIPTRAPDGTEFARLQNLIAIVPANRTDIDDSIHSWPAEASGGIFIQPYQSGVTVDDDRTNRWDLFTVLIHEMMHDLAHENFVKTRDLIGGYAQEVLKEGFADVFRHELWDGPGNLEKKVPATAYEPLRVRVEGAKYPYKASVVQAHSYYGETADAQKIANKVGMPNAKAAYFLGHTELLGLGAGTASAAPLANVAMYDPKHAAEKDTIVVSAGESYADIQARTNAPKNGILDSAGKVVPSAAPLAAGTKLRVPGIRYVIAISGETLGSIANQNAISIGYLAKANKLPAFTPETYPFPVGTPVLIPIHQAVP